MIGLLSSLSLYFSVLLADCLSPRQVKQAFRLRFMTWLADKSGMYHSNAGGLQNDRLGIHRLESDSLAVHMSLGCAQGTENTDDCFWLTPDVEVSLRCWVS